MPRIASMASRSVTSGNAGDDVLAAFLAAHATQFALVALRVAQDPRLVTEDRAARLGPGLEFRLATNAKGAGHPAQQDAAPLIVIHCRNRPRERVRSRGPAIRPRSGLGRFLVEHGDLVGQLRTLGNPVLDALEVELDALFRALRDRVVETHALDVAAVTRAAAVGDDDVVEGALLGAAAGKADLDHGAVFPVLPSRRNGGVSRKL